jgi:OmpA-OmpF porin, OOP family
MFRAVLFSGLLCLSLVTSAIASDPDVLAVLQKDAPGSADSVLTGRYEGSNIIGQTKKAFDEITLPNGPAEGEEYDQDKKFKSTLTLQGRITRTLYGAPEGRSSLEVFGNYVDALKAKGFAPVFECAKESCGPSFKILKYTWQNKATQVISQDSEQHRASLSESMFDSVIDPRYALMKKSEAGAETYVAVFAAQNQGGTFGNVSETLLNHVGVLVEVVEPKAREQKIVTLSADDLGAAISDAGRVAIYGLYFDFDKAAIKPESQPQLDQMVAYLEKNPDLKVYIVGHTDSKGALDYNMKLSGERAIAVVKALVSSGVNKGRMIPKAAGPIAPLASNRTTEGQAKNRRVELVEQYNGQ